MYQFYSESEKLPLNLLRMFRSITFYSIFKTTSCKGEHNIFPPPISKVGLHGHQLHAVVASCTLSPMVSFPGIGGSCLLDRVPQPWSGIVCGDGFGWKDPYRWWSSLRLVSPLSQGSMLSNCPGVRDGVFSA